MKKTASLLLFCLLCASATAAPYVYYETNLMTLAPARACQPGEALVHTGTIWSCTNQVADPCPVGEVTQFKDGKPVCARLDAPVLCPTGQVVTGIRASGKPNCGPPPAPKLACRSVTQRGPKPLFVSTATCDEDEFLASGAGACTDMLAKLRYNMPRENAWVTLCQTSGGANAPSAATAVCCK